MEDCWQRVNSVREYSIESGRRIGTRKLYRRKDGFQVFSDLRTISLPLIRLYLYATLPLYPSPKTYRPLEEVNYTSLKSCSRLSSE